MLKQWIKLNWCNWLCVALATAGTLIIWIPYSERIAHVIYGSSNLNITGVWIQGVVYTLLNFLMILHYILAYRIGARSWKKLNEDAKQN